jgi:hypothetical protein
MRRSIEMRFGKIRCATAVPRQTDRVLQAPEWSATSSQPPFHIRSKCTNAHCSVREGKKKGGKRGEREMKYNSTLRWRAGQKRTTDRKARKGNLQRKFIPPQLLFPTSNNYATIWDSAENPGLTSFVELAQLGRLYITRRLARCNRISCLPLTRDDTIHTFCRIISSRVVISCQNYI